MYKKRSVLLAAIVIIFASVALVNAGPIRAFLSPLLPPPIYDVDAALTYYTYGSPAYPAPAEEAEETKSLFSKDGMIETGVMGESDPVPPDPDVAIQQIQADFYATYGKYWQGLTTHDTIPTYGTPLPPDVDSYPSDQHVSWADVGVPLSDTMDIAVTVDVYDGPAGSGYTVRGEVLISDTLWVRTINFGPETWREHGWITMTTEAQ